MANPTKIVVDLSKPKGERETIVELTTEEVAERDARAAAAIAEEQAAQEAAEAKAAEAATARQKLIDLGLTESQIDALIN